MFFDKQSFLSLTSRKENIESLLCNPDTTEELKDELRGELLDVESELEYIAENFLVVL